jgi:type IV pilus assembly protein PilY1
VLGLCISVVSLLSLADQAFAKGGSIKVYFGTTTSYTPAVRTRRNYTAPVVSASGGGGSVKVAGTTISNGGTYSVSNNTKGVSYSVTPDGTHKISSIKLIYYADKTDDSATSIGIDSPATGTTTDSVDLKKDVTYILLVDFDDNINYQVSYTISADLPATPTTNCNTTAKVTQAGVQIYPSDGSTSPKSVSVSSGNTGIDFVIDNTNANCQVDAIDFNNTGYSTDGWNSVTKTFTTPEIAANTTFVIRYKGRSYQVITQVDESGSTTCGSISPATQYYGAGSSQVFTVTKNYGCAITSFTDNGDSATLSGSNTYTLSNIQANHTLTVKFASVATVSGASYCQVPAFMDGLNVLKPNVLIIFDTSGSMSDYPYRSKTYNCKEGYTLGASNCTKFFGLFDSAKMYKVDSSNKNKYLIDTTTTYNPAAPGGTGTGRGFSGNYLNYYYMQKVDIMRKILIGGQVDSVSGAARNATSGTYYLISNSNKIIQYGPAVNDGTINTTPTGLIHSVGDKVRLGMMVYNNNSNSSSTVSLDDDGGRISVPIGSSVNTLVAQIESNDLDPGGWTPLGETMYEALRYFQGGTSAYNTYDGTNKVSYNGSATDSNSPHRVYAKPVQGSCQNNYVLLLTDGEATNDSAIPSDTSYTSWMTTANSSTPAPPSELLAKIAYYAHNYDLANGTSTWGHAADPSKLQSLTLFSVFLFGRGATTLEDASKFGAYLEDKTVTGTNKNGRPDIAAEYTSPTDSTATRGYYEADDGAVIELQLKSIFENIITYTASGTAAAVANNKSGQRGANLIQALFYPQFPTNPSIKWLGEVQALWYYLDPIVNYSTILEDSDNNKILDLNLDSMLPSDPFDTKALWKAGAMLQTTTASSRHIYTLLDSTKSLTATENSFTSTNTTALKPLLNISSLTDTQAGDLINYLRGVDNALYRSRTVSFTNPSTGTTTTDVWKLGDIVNSTPVVQSAVPINSYHTTYSDSSYNTFINTADYKSRNVVYSGSNDGMLHAFRLGVTNALSDASRPYRIAQLTGTDLGIEEWAFIPHNALPYLSYQCTNDYCHQYTVDGAPVVLDASINIPTGCSETQYWKCPLTTKVTSGNLLDTAGTSWKTVLVGSMGLGGASRDAASSCNETYSPDSNPANNSDCVKSPVTGNGLSSYFALDVTDPLTPKYLWEFSDTNIADSADKGLGFTSPGATIVRISTGSVNGVRANGRWFAVMASGPTGAIDPSLRYFSGHSDQNLKIYVVDLNGGSSFTKCTAAGQANCNYWVIGNRPASGSRAADVVIPYAFASSLNGTAIDLDRSAPYKLGNYSDDVIYISYTKASLTSGYPSNSTAWNKGGVLRLVTNNDPDPFNWFTSILIDDVGPITTSVARVQDRNKSKLWVYFGEGRYFYPGDERTNGFARKLYGVQDPCYDQYITNSDHAMKTIASQCVAVDKATIQDQSGNTPSSTLSTGMTGWSINMATATGSSGDEREVSDVSATYNGLVFFTTYTPNSDICTPGGVSSLWAVKYDTGGTPPSSAMQGKAPLQTSSGGIKLISLASSFTQQGNRKLDASLAPAGMAPKGKFPPLLNPKPSKQVLQIREY